MSDYLVQPLLVFSITEVFRGMLFNNTAVQDDKLEVDQLEIHQKKKCSDVGRLVERSEPHCR
jgi:hypothetical protein